MTDTARDPGLQPGRHLLDFPALNPLPTCCVISVIDCAGEWNAVWHGQQLRHELASASR
jgi:hypothetical protein